MIDDSDAELRANLAHDRAYRDGLQAGFRLGQAEDFETYESLKRHYTREIVEAAKKISAEYDFKAEDAWEVNQ